MTWWTEISEHSIHMLTYKSMPITRYFGLALGSTAGWTISKPAYISVRTSLAVDQRIKKKIESVKTRRSGISR